MIIWSPSIILPFSSHIIILSASPSKEIPTLALYFFTAALIFDGYVDPHFSLIFKPLGLTPIEMTFAPSSFKSFGAAL